jgi:hypothetical protein
MTETRIYFCLSSFLMVINVGSFYLPVMKRAAVPLHVLEILDSSVGSKTDCSDSDKFQDNTLKQATTTALYVH